MKKVLIMCLVLIVIPYFSIMADDSGTARYAIDKGSILIGGTAGIASMGGDARGDESATVISFNPSVMYFVMKNVAVGGQAGFQHSKYGDIDQTYYGIGPKGTYYFGGENSRFYLFLSIGFLYGKMTDEYSESILRFSAGNTYMITKNIGVTGEAYYQMENYSPDKANDTVSGYTFGAAFGISAFVF